MKNFYPLLILFFLSYFQATSQININDIVNENEFATVSSCDDSYFINNENNGLSNKNIVFTICPDNDNLVSTLDFTTFTAPEAFLDFIIYDGDDITANEIPYDGSVSLVTASDPETNPTGCITVAISSTFIPSVINSEIAFDVGCREICDIPSSLVNLEPSYFNTTSGFYEVGNYIPVTFEIDHEELDNESYTYEWDFGDEETTTTNIPFVQHVYTEISEYNVQVTVIDQFGCETLNTDLANVEVISRTSDSCADAQPFCAGGELFFFPNINNETPGGATSAEPGPDYGCLGIEPYPAWFYFQVDQAGDFEFLLQQNTNADFSGTNLDVDFIVWGPFDTPAGNCDNLTSANEIDCSYSVSATETMIIPNTVQGDFYIVLITNFNTNPGFISFQQTNAGGENAGLSSCPILNEEISLCNGDEYTIIPSIPANVVDNQVNYTWEIFNETTQAFEIIPDENDLSITVQSPGGTFKLTASNPITGSFVEGTIVVNYFETPSFQSSIENLVLCEEDSNNLEVNLNQADFTVEGINESQLSIAFYATETDAFNGLNSIANPSAYQPQNQSETIFIRAENNLSQSCYSISSFEIINNFPEITIPIEPLLDCDEDATGTATFDLTSFEDVIYQNLNPSDFSTTYYETLEDANTQENPIGNPQDYAAITGITPIFILVDNGDCSTTLSVEVNVNPNDVSCEGIGTESFSQQVKFYPNPVTSILKIDYSSLTPIESLKIYNINGQLIFQQKYNRLQNYLALNFSDFATGIFFVEIDNGIEKAVKKVIKI
ncbi:T9SS type A sorting domain-containing protein [Psychroflexus planctonicus]|uniref:PKD domain-containing protein n=1 Tax=Psychroflexus planctonicus TaxID=1526575 RepID=A0ABQ1SIX4_9FLAO|nr:T9SS type A sorting domain-containing protein [Psychroflexus planctonicus]GGE42345.1 hypothetical protein GCM10010832_22870 [Psychroflexus planctonicus]